MERGAPGAPRSWLAEPAVAQRFFDIFALAFPTAPFPFAAADFADAFAFAAGFFAVAFFAPLDFAAVFFAAGFLAAAFFGAAFFAALFFAAGFFAEVAFALAAGFFALPFLAAGLLLAFDFVVGVFLVAMSLSRRRWGAARGLRKIRQQDAPLQEQWLARYQSLPPSCTSISTSGAQVPAGRRRKPTFS